MGGGKDDMISSEKLSKMPTSTAEPITQILKCEMIGFGDKFKTHFRTACGSEASSHKTPNEDSSSDQATPSNGHDQDSQPQLETQKNIKDDS